VDIDPFPARPQQIQQIDKRPLARNAAARGAQVMIAQPGLFGDKTGRRFADWAMPMVIE